MVRLETTLLDKFVNGAYAGKRVIGSPLKYNIKTKARGQGWVEMVFHPRNRVEQIASDVLRFIHPYLFYVTLRFHAEKAREGGKYQFTHRDAGPARRPRWTDDLLSTRHSDLTTLRLLAFVVFSFLLSFNLI